MSDRRSQRLLAAPLFGLALGSLAVPAMAQTPPPGSPAAAPGLQSGASGLQSSQGVSTPPPPAAVSAVPPIPTGADSLLPDLFGFRRMLTDHGVGVILDTVDEFAGSISGGGGPPSNASNKTGGGSSIAGQVALETDIDFERLAGITGFSAHSIILGRYGGHPASTLIGDNLNPSQEIYGAGGNVVAHLVQVYGEETLAGGALDIQAGIIPLDDNYMASPLYCNFMNNSLCGNPKTSTDNIYHSSYPDGVYAFNVRVRPIPTVYVQSGIYFGTDNIYNPAKNFRSGFTRDTSYINGEAFPVEIGWEPAFGPNHMPGHYKVGFIYDNNHHTDDYFDVNGAPYALSGLKPRVRTGSTSGYVLFDQMVDRLGPGPNDGVVVLGGYYHNDEETSTRANQFFGGVVATNFWHARPQDAIAFLYTWQNVSGKLGKTQALQQALGVDPIYGGLANGASGVQNYNEILELNYQIHVYRGVEFAPDFQYFIHPNAQSNLSDAAFLGFKTHVTFFSAATARGAFGGAARQAVVIERTLKPDQTVNMCPAPPRGDFLHGGSRSRIDCHRHRRRRRRSRNIPAGLGRNQQPWQRPLPERDAVDTAVPAPRRLLVGPQDRDRTSTSAAGERPGSAEVTGSIGKAALFAAMLLSACANVPKGPVIGTWEGEPPGPDVSVSEIVTLTLWGTPDASSGRYQVSTTVRADFLGGGNPGLTTWSGTWTRQTGQDNGQPRSIIYLHDALSSEINQYAIGPDNTLQPTSAYLSRSLTPQEIALYTLRPLSGTTTLAE